jgi:hypothetical protein
VSVVTDTTSAWGDDLDEAEVSSDFHFIRQELEHFLGEGTFEIIYEAHRWPNEAERPDCIVVDYGGAYIAERWSAMSLMRTALKWADDHPSKLLLLWTPYSGRAFEEVIDETRSWGDETTDRVNVLVRPYLIDGTEQSQRFQAELRQKLGV